MDVEKLAAELGVEVGIVERKSLDGSPLGNWYEASLRPLVFRFQSMRDLSAAIDLAAALQGKKPSGGLPGEVRPSGSLPEMPNHAGAGVGHLPGWQNDKPPADGEALDSRADEGGADPTPEPQAAEQEIPPTPPVPAQPQAVPGTVSGASFADRQNNPTAAGNRRPADTTAKRRVQVARGGTVV